jgi:hypothetical protein
MMHLPRQLARSGRAAALAIAFAVAAASCGDATTAPAAPDAGADLRLPLIGGSSSSRLLECDPAPAAQTVTGIVDALGGTLAIGGTRVVIPANAVLGPTTFRMTIPASRLVEISVKAGEADHFVFALPVMVSIDYGRCAPELSALQPLSVWHIDESSKALLENMSGVDLRLFHTITFFTGHLSGYAVAD